MRRITSLLAALLVVGTTLTGCAPTKGERASLYDLGPLNTSTASAPSNLPPISISRVSVPAWLDSTRMYYRLNYANEQQPQAYAHARWTMTPAQLLLQNLKVRIAQSGGVVLAESDAGANVPVLRLEVDDFTQSFSAPDQSRAQVALRASVLKGRKLVAQKMFAQRVPAPNPDAAGGARALAAASDAAITELMTWMGTLDLK